MTTAGVTEGQRSFLTRELFGIPIAALSLSEAVELVDAAVRSRRRLLIGVVNAAKVVNMARDPSLREHVLSSDIILADGMAVVWAARLLGRPLPERVAGIDLMHGILASAENSGYRVFCLGATEEVLDGALRKMTAIFPKLVIAGRHHGYFDKADEESVAAAISKARSDIVFIAMTSPKKEIFLARWGPRVQVPVWHGVGGSFDVLAGKVKRAPAAWQRWGLEWLYRVKQEPRRLWRRYLVTNTIFCGLVAREWLGRSKRSRKTPLKANASAPRE